MSYQKLFPEGIENLSWQVTTEKNKVVKKGCPFIEQLGNNLTSKLYQ